MKGVQTLLYMFTSRVPSLNARRDGWYHHNQVTEEWNTAFSEDDGE